MQTWLHPIDSAQRARSTSVRASMTSREPIMNWNGLMDAMMPRFRGRAGHVGIERLEHLFYSRPMAAPLRTCRLLWRPSRRAGVRSSAGRRGAGHGAAPGRAARRPIRSRSFSREASRRTWRRADRPDRLPGARRDPRAGRAAAQRQRRPPRRAELRRDDPRPAARRRGPGRRRDRRLAGSRPGARSGRGRRPRRPARLARRPDARTRSTRACRSPAMLLAGRSVDLLVIDLPPRPIAGTTAGQGRRSTPPARRAGPPGGDAPRRPRAARA